LVTRLPSREDVLVVFLHHRSVGESGPPSLSRWSTWSIITSRTFKYVSFKKEAKRETPAAVTKREVWKGDLQDVFDIASSKIAEANAAEEVFAFLELKREDRLGCR